MASNSIEAVVTGHDFPPTSSQSPKPQLKTSTARPHRSHTASMAAADIFPSGPDPHTALFHGHDHHGLVGRVRQHMAEGDDDAIESIHNHTHNHTPETFLNRSASKRSEQMVTPFLAQHIPAQYNPLGGGSRPQNAPGDGNTKYCYRHRPDMLCRRQADEPSMEQLQEVGC